jgi:hypothetical protein
MFALYRLGEGGGGKPLVLKEQLNWGLVIISMYFMTR